MHLAHYVRGKRATWLIERDVKKKKNALKKKKKKKWQKATSAVVFLNSDGYKEITGTQDGG